jgi:hypothetical protein
MTIDNSNQLNNAREAISKGDKKTAKQILAGILNQDKLNADAWLLLADVLDDPQHRIECLKRVLQINPNNVSAKKRLDDLIKPASQNVNAAPVKTNNPPKATTKKIKSRPPILIIIIIVVVLCFAIAYAMGSNTGSGKPDANGMDASIICENFITSRLKAPTTAKFSDYADDQIYTLTDKVNSWRIIGYVDAENSFGAQIRTHYTCDIQYVGGDWSYDSNWTILNLVTQ